MYIWYVYVKYQYLTNAYYFTWILEIITHCQISNQMWFRIATTFTRYTWLYIIRQLYVDRGKLLNRVGLVTYLKAIEIGSGQLLCKYLL